MLIGRAPGCDLTLTSPRVSAKHARLTFDAGTWWVEDLGSTNGTRVDGKRIRARTALHQGTEITIGGETLRVTVVNHEHARPTRAPCQPAPPTRAPGQPRPPLAPLRDASGVHRIALTPGVMTIGRDTSNDLVITDRNVSRFHAELRVDRSRREIRDLGSSNGTRLDGKLIDRAEVTDGNEIGIGAYRLVLSATDVRTTSGRGCLVARGVAQHVKGGVRVLRPTDLRLEPGTLVAVIGEAGSGKSTLVKILAGVTRPSAGSVHIDGDPLSLRLPDIGYVPQSEILHRSLTIREALRYGARLRLPPDSGPEEIDAAVARVLRDLDLDDHADKQIRVVSGGQQRRVSVGMEMLGSPRILLLDEPGASLDVRLEGQLMDALRDLTGPERAVLAVTHRTTFLTRFDRLLVMGRGGVVRFDGAPLAALEHFAVTDFDAIYDRLAELPDPGADAEEEPRRPLPAPKREPAPPTRQRQGVFGHQLAVLAGRTARVLTRDQRNLAFLILQVPVLATGAAMLFGGDAFANTQGQATKSAQLLFVLAIVATWVGTIDGARALVSEREIFVRERSIGVRAAPYLVSKLLVLGALACVQTAVLAAVAFQIAPLERGVATYVAVIVLLLLATLVALASGLLLSATASTEDQAASLLPLLLVPQLLCAGAIVGVKDMGSLKVLSAVISARWTLAGSGSALALPGGRSADDGFRSFYGGFFDAPWSVSALVLALFVCVIASATGWRLHAAWR